METIRICKDRNVLAEFFSEREKEVVDIMMTLFNEEYILKTYVESEKQEAAEKTKIGTAQRLYEMGISVQDIAKACQATVETVEQWLSLVKAQNVGTIMILFSEEYILMAYVKSKEEEASDKTKKGIAQKLHKKGNSIEEITGILDVSVKEVEQWLGFAKV